MATIESSVKRNAIHRSDKGRIRVLDKAPKRRTYSDHRDKRFVAWDGEGGNDANGTHRYLLFGNSDGARVVSETGIGWLEALDLLMQSPKNAIHVVFAGTYDVVKMFETASPKQLDRLHGSQPVYFDRYRVWWLRGKWLRVQDRQTGETRTLFDVFSFFGKSFVKACAEYGVKAELDAIQAMKDKRSEFRAITPEVEHYMSMELDALVMLMETLRARLAAVGIHPSSWHGPGAIASTVLKSRKVSEARGTYDDRFRLLAESAYYGGRFEQFQRGHHKGPVWEYDIRSAYPSAMQHLPDLASVQWYRTKPSAIRTDRLSPFGLYRVQGLVTYPFGLFPWRNRHGAIFYPTTFLNGWYWGIEVPEYARPYIVDAWEPEGDGLYARPFSFVPEMYDARARLKTEGKPEQLAYKLALNSFYGKLAQSKGARYENGTWRLPSFHEPVWAGWITAYTRSRIRDAALQNPSAVIAVETDALFTTEPLEVDLGTGLGQWEQITADGIIYLQSGVYFLREGDEWNVKSRGFSPRGHDAQTWLKNLRKLPRGTDEGIAVAFNRFITDRRQSAYGQWKPSNHLLRLDQSESKRVHRADHCGTCTGGYRSYASGLHRLVVPKLVPEPTTPYPFPWRNAKLAGELEELYELESFIMEGYD